MAEWLKRHNPKFDAAFAEKITALALHHVVRTAPLLPSLPRRRCRAHKCGRGHSLLLMDLSAGFEEPRVVQCHFVENTP